MDLLNKAKKIKTQSIIGIVLFFTLFGMIVTFVLEIINGIQILATDWENEKLNDDKTLRGIFTFVLLGPIASLVFASIAIKELNKNQPSVQTNTINQ